MKAGLKEVPVLVKQYTKQEILEISLIENLQREDLNPIEEAIAFQRLITEFNLTQDEVAEKVSKSRSAVTNSIRLLKLSEKIQQMVITDQISNGHARALLSLEDEKARDELADKIVKDNLTVRDVEKLTKEYGQEKKPSGKIEVDESLKNVYRDIEEQLKGKMNTKVRIVPSSTAYGAGKLEIEFYSSDDLEMLVQGVMGTQKSS
ncbi:MAG: ParB/RepB/Spo0J family partition protein, partial [Lachnospiraceae bacterium]|nr:ParB/RepB/Spo0J family partition protein [Lachnospiraceae bacterium]